MLYGWELLTREEEDLISRGVRDGNVYGGPFHLSIYPTDKCNLDCFFCYTEDLRKVAAELDWDILKRAMTDGIAMGVKAVSFGGGGEPMIYRQMMPLMDLIEENGIVVDSIKSNGTAITPRLAASLMRSKLARITVSLNETTPETYGEMNQCSPRLFERAMAGIDNLLKARAEFHPKSEVGVQIFVWKGNYKRLIEMVETVIRTGTDVVYINTIDQHEREKKMTAAEKEELKPLIREVLQRWPRNIQLNLWSEGLAQFGAEEHHKVWKEAVELPDMVKTDYRIEYCYVGWHSPVITASGHMFPCCHFSTDITRTFGTLQENSLREIWYGELANRYRAEMRHLMLTAADPKLAQRNTCFVHPLCKQRATCAFNYYLASPKFYHEIHDWAESGPRQLYSTQQRIKTGIWNGLRTGKRLARKLVGGSN